MGRGQVVLHPALGAPSAAVLAWTWLCVALASAGLVLLYRTTVADPGFLPCARHPARGTKEVLLHSYRPGCGHHTGLICGWTSWSVLVSARKSKEQ